MDKIVLGTVQFGINYGINNYSGKPNEHDVFKILLHAQKVGINTLDTAEDYGNAQSLIGEYHKSHSNHFEIISKLSHSYKDDNGLQKHVKRMLEVLNISCLSLYMFHNFSVFKAASYLKEEFKQLKEDGWTKKIGVSVYTNDEFLTAINNDWIDVIQIPLNLLDNNFQKGHLLELAKFKGKEIHARSIFLQGLFFMADERLPAPLRELQPYLKRLHELEVKMDTSIESLSLQYVYNNPYVDKVLIGIDSIEQLNLNVNGIQHPVNRDFMEEIDSINVKESWLLNPANWK